MEEQWMPGSKKELMSAIEREWILLRAVAEKLTDRQMTSPDEGGWSPKDNLAHLTEWMKLLIGHHLDHRPADEVLGISTENDVDFNIINSLLFEKNRHRSRQDVCDEMKQVYGQLIHKLESMDFEELMAPRDPHDHKKRPLVLWVLGNTSEHFEEHRSTIEKNIQA